MWGDKVETTTPGLVLAEHGQGRFAYVPWDVGGLYYRHSSQGHSGLMADVIDRLLPNGRQLKTNAHPLVEMTVMDQPGRKRTLVHLVNGIGHSDTAYFPPVELRDIRVELTRKFARATAVSSGERLQVADHGPYRSFTLSSLEVYEVVVVE